VRGICRRESGRHEKRWLSSAFALQATARQPSFASRIEAGWLAEPKLASKRRLVADAVYVEPVSTSEFPASWEKNREFCKIGASALLYQERQKTTGIEINVGERGISIEKK
jgi:hypothetical protein